MKVVSSGLICQCRPLRVRGSAHPHIDSPVICYTMRAMKKRAPGGGRKKRLTPCPFCRKAFGVRELIAHLPRCPKRKDVR